MARRSKIRWSDADKKAVSMAVRVFNTKRTKTIKKDPSAIEYLPSKINVADVISKINTRADLKRELNSLKRFSRTGAEGFVKSDYGVKINKWERDEVALKNRTINTMRAKKKKQYEALKVTSRGKDQGVTRGMMGSPELQDLQPRAMRMATIKSRKEWELFVKSTEKMGQDDYYENKNQRLKENYIKGLRNAFGETDTSGEDYDTRQLEEVILEMSMEEFLDTFYSDQEASIPFIYDPIEESAKLQALYETWGVEKRKNFNTTRNTRKRNKKH